MRRFQRESKGQGGAQFQRLVSKLVGPTFLTPTAFVKPDGEANDEGEHHADSPHAAADSVQPRGVGIPGTLVGGGGPFVLHRVAQCTALRRAAV